MEKILLLAGKDADSLDLISLIAEGEYDFQTVVVDNQEKAISTIEKLGNKLYGVFNTFETIDVVGSTIYRKNYTTRKAPYIHILNVKDISPKNFESFFAQSAYNLLIPKEKIHKELHGILSKIENRYDLVTEHTKPVSKDGKRLYRLNIKRFLNEKIAIDDIYIKIGSGKYLKLIHAGNDIDQTQIMEYIDRGEKYLYQAEEDFLNTINTTMDNIIKKFNDSTLNKAQTVGLQLSSIKEVQDIARNMGINQSIIDTTDELVRSVEKMIKDTKQLSSIVKKLLRLKSRFFTRTSVNNYLLGGISEKMGWESHQTLKKLIYASVFCDFSFEPSDAHLAEILSLHDQEYKNIGKVNQLRVKTHPKLSAAILEKGNSLLTDEASLIAHHHEKPDGSGFPEGLDYKTLPVLSCAFILSYDFTTKLIKSCDNPEDINPLSVFQTLGEEYSKANFNKPYMSLKEILERK